MQVHKETVKHSVIFMGSSYALMNVKSSSSEANPKATGTGWIIFQLLTCMLFTNEHCGDVFTCNQWMPLLLQLCLMLLCTYTKLNRCT